MGTDLRPVFPEERLLLEIILKEPFKFANSSIWNVGGSCYIVDGKKLHLSYAKIIKESNVKEIISELNKHKKENQKFIENYFNSRSVVHFIKINSRRLNSITYEAVNYIRESAKGIQEDEMFVSFSGGKDSTVVSDLVINALGKNVIHIYGDTTLEYPTSESYIKRFKEKHPLIPMLTAKNKDQDFNNLCEVIGPPSRMLRWCCTVFKTGAITKKIDSTFKDSKSILTFQGIRRNESLSRSKYDRESNDSKIKKQIAINPIIDWTDFDVWLYILSNNIDFNDAYRQGFSRVGCWCCPNNSAWSEFLSAIYMNDKYNLFKDILYRYAQKVGKPDWKTYIDDGEWKKRQGGNGLEISKKSLVSFKPCALEENT
ncbi:MAG TPA: phosphoadenosine phosphosulfate reductase family protein, partial [Candidatus Caccosoma faecigallinarum]|nr:phosphoadenosine phosphosulfate reductase family protein [Candidatus Caccosoma faecigallinarum]